MSSEIPRALDSYRALKSFMRKVPPHHPYVIAINRNPFNKQAIKTLKEEGWRVEFHDFASAYIKRDKRILFIPKFGEMAVGLQRDATIFHEAIHAHYGDVSNDGFIPIMEHKINGAITEYLARKSRTDPFLLATLWDCFAIPTQIYDGVSFLAAQIREPQNIPHIDFKDLSKYLF